MKISKANGGMLSPQSVVSEARSVKHPLHECFQWDDKLAGDAYRLWQARQLIRVVVEIIPSSDGKPINVFVSMKNDRHGENCGYRTMVDVMSDADMREQLLEQAFEELEVFKRKYQRLSELAPVFESVRRVKGKRIGKMRSAHAAA